MQTTKPTSPQSRGALSSCEKEPDDGAHWLNSVGAWASVFGAFLTIASTIIAVAAFYDYIRESIVHWYVISVNFVLLVFSGLVCFVHTRLQRNSSKERLRVKRDLDGKQRALDDVTKEKEDLKEKYLRAVRGIENISRERTGLTDCFVAIYRGVLFDQIELRHRGCEFLNKLLTHTKEIFDVHTGHVCSVCIKIFSKHDAYSPHRANKEAPSQHVVRTLLRDSASSTERKAAADQDMVKYPYFENTAFSEIMHPSGVSNFWFSNDLAALRESYKNGHSSWRTYYNATAVIGIRAPTGGGSDYTIGFLCVDNLNGGFDDQQTKYILGTMANTLYYVLSSLYLVQSDGIRPGETDA